MLKLVRALIKRWGPTDAKQRVWNAEYKKGEWDYLAKERSTTAVDPIYEFLDRYQRQGTILDLGCGDGSTALETKNTFLNYVGVDVSDLAILNAQKAIAKDSSRSNKVRFLAGNISECALDGHFSVILFRESIYYVPKNRIKKMLDHYSLKLAPGGVFIVRIWDRGRFSGIIQILESNFLIMEKCTPQNSTLAILVFQPRIPVQLSTA